MLPENLGGANYYAALHRGHNVQTYGSGDIGIDAFQLESAGNYRDKDKPKDTAD